MSKHARLSVEEHAVERDRARIRRAPRRRTRYYAFLSYSHDDEAIADWLHRELEKFRVPHSLSGRLTEHGAIPRRLTPIFRDQHELSASDDLADGIERALASSQFLIVLCSPTAAVSRWTNAEIEAFKRTRPEGCVLAVIASGEPFASDMPGREAEECFPPALRYRYDRRGRPTTKRAEPLAADLRGGPDDQRTGLLKLIAGMLGVGLDELVQRETTRRHRHLGWLAAASLAGMAVTSTLAVTAIQARDAAREQRREAEGLVEFMLGDLKDKLEPIGKLDVLDGVGSRVLNYYSRQDTTQLSDIGLSQRSKALTLMGQISRDRGELGRAEALYRQAYAGTAEEVSRDPNDARRLYDHAQNAFYTADIAFRRGDLAGFETASREYKSLADRMVGLDPNNMKWRMESNYADFNLGVALYDRRLYRQAVQQFVSALSTIEALAAADRANDTYQDGVADALAWVSYAQGADGRLAEAVETQKQYVGTIERLVAKSGADARFRLILGHRDLGALYAAQGSNKLALQEFSSAVGEGERLRALDPANTKWLQSTETAQLMLLRQLLDQGDTAQVSNQVGPICSAFDRSFRKDPNVVLLSGGLRDCLMLEARLAARSGQAGNAAALADKAVEVARSVKSADPADGRFGLAGALRLQGDTRKNDPGAARSAWLEALAAIPAGVAEKPVEMDEHATILERLGRGAEAAQMRARLAKTGYRRAESKVP